MEFVEAMSIVNRMCTTTNSCDECPMNEKIEESASSCMGFFMRCPEEAEAILAKWNAEHPVKTLKSVFNESFPNAPKHVDRYSGIPYICVTKLGYSPESQSDVCCPQNCAKCWNQEYKEPTK